MKNAKSRIDWLDFAKFTAIFLMVICHTKVPRTFDSIVHAFHMPVFFVLSGWCFNIKRHSSFGRFIVSRLRTLIIPYLFWGVVIYAAWNGFYSFVNRSKCVPVADFLRSLLYNNAESSPFCAVQWFLTCMFFAQLISWLVIKLSRSRFVPVLISSVCLAALGWALPYMLSFRLPLALDVAVSSSFFYLVGWMIPNCINGHLGDRAKKALLSPWMIPAELILGIAAAYLNGYVNMRLITFENPLLFYVSAILLSLGISHISYEICRHAQEHNVNKPYRLYNLALFCGRNTLPILMLNQVFIQAVRLIINDLAFYKGMSSLMQYALWFGVAVLVMLVMIPVILLINRTIPFSVGKKRSPVKQS